MNKFDELGNNLFLINIKEQLMKERELLEKQIQEKKVNIKNQIKGIDIVKRIANLKGTSHIKRMMKSRIKQYKKSLEEVGKTNNRNPWYKSSDIEAVKRGVSTMNTRKYLEYQTEEKVVIALTHRELNF